MTSNGELQQLIPEMKQRFEPEKAEGVDAMIQFDLSGDEGGLYWAKIVDGTLDMGEGEVENPRMTLKAKAEDFIALLNGELNPMQAFMNGRLKVEGDMGLALKLQSIFNF